MSLHVNFLVLGIYLLILLSGDSEGAGWIRFFHGGSVENEGDNYGVNNFLVMTTWRLFFSNGDIKVEIMSPPWNNFLWSVLRFVVVRSGHDEGLGRIIFRSVFRILQWLVGHMFSGLLPSVYLCGHPYEASYRFGFEI